MAKNSDGFRMQWRGARGVRDERTIQVGGWADANEKRANAKLMAKLRALYVRDPRKFGAMIEAIAARDLGPFQWIPRSEAELRDEWLKLVNLGEERKHRRAEKNRIERHQGIDKTGEVKSRSVGQAILWEVFHDALLRASGNKFPSFMTVWSNPHQRQRLWRQLFRLEHYTFSFQALLKTFAMSFYQPSNFPPGAAHDLIDHQYDHSLSSRQGLRILDPSAGFGGRLLGFLASTRGALYVGNDPNTALGPCYKRLVALVKRWTPNQKQVKMIAARAETDQYVQELERNGYGPHTFDMVLTSPPYFDTELYSAEASQSSYNFPTLQKWILGFLLPMLVNVVWMTKPGGILLLNIKNVRKWNFDATKFMTDFLVSQCHCVLVREMYLNLYKRVGAGHQDRQSGNKEPIFYLRTTKLSIPTRKHRSAILAQLQQALTKAASPTPRRLPPQARAKVARPAGGEERLGEYKVLIPNGVTRFARYDLVIKKSKIHGLGVFTKQPIPAKSKIVKWQDGQEITYAEMKRLYTGSDGKIDWRYTYKTRPYQMQVINKQWSERNVNNYLNDGVHGQRKPNVNVMHTRRWLVAKRDIQAGEELLLDCGKAYWASTQHA